MVDKVFRKNVVVLLVLTLVFSPAAFASKTGGIIAGVSGITAGKWGIIAVVDPEPISKTVCGVVSGVWWIIAGGATLYDAIADPPPDAAPKIEAVYEGFTSDRNPDDGELLPPPTAPVDSAHSMRIVSIHGSNFSWVKDEMTVTFGGVEAEILPLSTNTLVMAIVPFADPSSDGTGDLHITVNDTVSAPHAFQVLPPRPLFFPPAQTKNRLLTKEKKMLRMVAGANWEALLDEEAPHLSADERASALVGAKQMANGAAQILSQIDVAASGLGDPSVLAVFATLVESNPEMEKYFDAAIDDLTQRGVADYGKQLSEYFKK